MYAYSASDQKGIRGKTLFQMKFQNQKEKMKFEPISLQKTQIQLK